VAEEGLNLSASNPFVARPSPLTRPFWDAFCFKS
jgi:hypothetical protein